MGTCSYCNNSVQTISDTIGFCADCIRSHFDVVWPQIKKVHNHSRMAYSLPMDPPRADDGIRCGLCVHNCCIPEGETGYCGLRQTVNGRIRGGRPHEGNLSYYYDALPTNCVGNFVCPAGTACGYPQYSVFKGPEHGHKNLAVFYHACAFNCLYCQNYHFKASTFSSIKIPAKKLAQAVDKKTTCICYFGGDPTPQILHAIKASKIAIKNANGRILRICWETNGSVKEPYLTMMADLSLKSGGLIKFDLKAWSEKIHYALCGVTNAKTLKNFQSLSRWIDQRPRPPLLMASTLLIPGYVDEAEVAQLAEFIAYLNPKIPYSLLAFHPQFYLNDLPTTSTSQAFRCQEAALNAGLSNVHIGNLHLLAENY